MKLGMETLGAFAALLVVAALSMPSRADDGPAMVAAKVETDVHSVVCHIPRASAGCLTTSFDYESMQQHVNRAAGKPVKIKKITYTYLGFPAAIIEWVE